MVKAVACGAATAAGGTQRQEDVSQGASHVWPAFVFMKEVTALCSAMWARAWGFSLSENLNDIRGIEAVRAPLHSLQVPRDLGVLVSNGSTREGM